MTKPNNKGVALIAAVVTAVIFLMLVMTVVVVSMSTYKKSGQSHDRAMALYLAEAGINDALYQMNYRYYSVPITDGARYPTGGEYLNPTFSPGPTPTPPMWQSSLPSPKDPFGIGLSNGYIVQFFAGSGPNLDELRSTGIYNGKRRVVSINIRGTNTLGSPLNNPANGIAEAFNKHAVYAGTVAYTSGTSGTVNGNITSTNDLSAVVIGGNNSKTLDPNILFPVPNITAYNSAPLDPGAGPAGWDKAFKDEGAPGPRYDAVAGYTIRTSGPASTYLHKLA